MVLLSVRGRLPQVSVTEFHGFFICLLCRDARLSVARSESSHAWQKPLVGWMMAVSRESGEEQFRLAVPQGGWYTTAMRPAERLIVGLVGCLVVTIWLAEGSGAAMGRGVFQGFTEHITRQIAKDKVDFAEAESCTFWFYRELKKALTDRSEVQRLSLANEDPDRHFCAKRYPGIDEARAAFAQSQSFLSLSLTFYQFALVADRDDDKRYDAVELSDILDSLHVVPVEGGLPLDVLARLNGKFDDVRHAAEFTALTQGMQVLYDKGYRLTREDQSAMGRVTGDP